MKAIVEGVAGTYHYHLVAQDGDTLALCGARVMKTNLPLSTWGYRGHLWEHYWSDVRTRSRRPRGEIDASMVRQTSDARRPEPPPEKD